MVSSGNLFLLNLFISPILHLSVFVWPTREYGKTRESYSFRSQLSRVANSSHVSSPSPTTPPVSQNMQMDSQIDSFPSRTQHSSISSSENKGSIPSYSFPFPFSIYLSIISPIPSYPPLPRYHWHESYSIISTGVDSAHPGSQPLPLPSFPSSTFRWATACGKA